MKNYHQRLNHSAISVKKIIEKSFTKMHVTGPRLHSEEINKNPAMITCSHRSHLDYVLLGLVFNSLGMNNIRFAAGENLTSLPYIGKMFLSYGAFPVSRDKILGKSYIMRLCESVVTMLHNGDNIIVFPEGGRSYDGSMLEMKNGIVAANIFAQSRMPDKKFIYIPTSISYEILPELSYFDILENGKKLRALKSNFISRLRGQFLYFGADSFAFIKFFLAHYFKKKYGNVYIDYGTPIAVNDIVDIHKKNSNNTRNPFVAYKESIKAIGEELRCQLLSLYRLLPMHVVASALVQSSHSSRKSDIVKKIPDIINYCQKQKRNCKSLRNLSEIDILDKGIEQLQNFKALKVIGNTIIMQKIKIIRYFAASILYEKGGL